LSECRLTLIQVVQQLDCYDDGLLIWARARTDLADLTPDCEALVAPGLEDDGVWWQERGLSYVLEVELAKEAIQVWRQWRDGAEPSAAQRCATVIHYALNDAYLEPDADKPADGPQGGGSGTSEHLPTD
jgi:hypothetical protein